METKGDVVESLVLRLSEMISEKELDILRKAAIEDYSLENVQCIDTFQDIFQELCAKTKVSRIELLQQVLLDLNRKDLIKIAKEYRKEEFSNLYRKHTGTESEQITMRIEYLSYTEDHVQELVQKLSNIFFAPVNSIIINRVEELSSGGYICVLEVAGIYADLLQEELENDDETTGLNYFGVTNIYIRNTAHKVKGKMVPVEMLDEHQKLIAVLKDQNQDFIQRLDKLSESLDTLLPIVAELGDLKLHMKKLEHLHKHSGMSTTIWKILGKLTDDQLPEKYRPYFSQDELRQQCLYSNARIQRVYPQLSMPVQMKKKVNSETSKS